MPKFLRKIITIGLIVTLLLPRGIGAVSPVIAQESTPEPTAAESASTQEPSSIDQQPAATETHPTSAPTVAPTSAPQPTSAPKEERPRQPEGSVHDSATREETDADRSDRSDDGPDSAQDSGEAPAAGTGTVLPTPTSTDTTKDTATDTNTVADTGSSAGTASTEQSSSTPMAGPNGTAAAAYLALYGATTGGINDPANTVTGPGSTNTATESTDVSQETMNKNIANLTNLLNLNASTGFNYANLNTLPGQVVTGDADNTLNLLNKLNTNISGVGGFATYDIYGTQTGDITFGMANAPANGSFDAASGQVSKNAVTGPGSDNTATAQDGFTVKEANGNDAQITNTIKLQSITGDNSASFNTLGGSVTTGNASALANIINMANTNIQAQEWLFGVVNIYGSLYGNIVLPQDTAGGTGQHTITTVGNDTTGALSNNTASSATNDTKSFTTANTADITSNLNVDADTGNNDASFNTYGATIETGDAQTLVNNTSVANVNAVNPEGTIWLVIVNEMGKWIGKIIGAGEANVASSLPFTTSSSGNAEQTHTVDATNGATGPLSQNDASYQSTSDQSVTSENNAAITNNIVVKADTGNNQANFNTGHAAIKTGDATAGINLLNMANVNLVAKKVVVLFVNVIGSFFGDVVPPDQQKERDIAAPAVTTDSSTGGTGGIGGTSDSSETAFEHASNEVGYTRKTTAAAVTVSTDTNGASSISYRQTTRSRSRSTVSTASVAGVSTKTTMTPTVTPSKLKRGVFISPAFAAAGESTPLAELFQGARINITNAWLLIIPFAAGVLYIRRRNRIDVMKYVNGMLSALL